MNPSLKEPHLPGLDLLRASAIILVFIFHCPYFYEQPLIGFFNQIGWAGVDLFFVLSGFLIGNQLFSNITKDKPFSLKNFYLRRFLRTFPNYFFVLALYFLIPAFAERPIETPLWKFLTFTQNFNLHLSGYSQAWSLCVEEQFYLFFPLIVLFFCMKRSLRGSWFLIAWLLIGGIILRTILWFAYVEYAANETVMEYFNKIYYPSYTHFDGLILGIAIALLKNFYSSYWKILMDYGNIILTIGLIIMFATFYFMLNRFELIQTALGFSLLALSFAALTIAALSPASVLYSLKVPGAATIAKWSYAIYLTHKQFIIITNKILVSNGVPYSFIIYTSETIIMCLGAGWMLYFFVEKPFMMLRDRITQPLVFPVTFS